MLKTLLIVGAGASKEAGLPTGREMATDIAKRLDIQFRDRERVKGDPAIVAALFKLSAREDGGSNPSSYLTAAKQICVAMPQAKSIDAFIDDHHGNEGIETCGKLAIVRSILYFEKKSLLSVKQNFSNINFAALESEEQKTWYNQFWRLLTGPNETISERLKEISFIIFNYDRCIEQFLYCALKNYYGLSNDEAAEHVNSIEIHHPYGTVGRLPWQQKQNTIDYGVEARGDTLLALSSLIRTYTERVIDESAVNSMRQLVRTAEQIIFLGFAFHKQNIDLIKPEEKTKCQRVFLTTRGMSDSDRDIILQRIERVLTKNELPVKSIVKYKSKLSCCELFNEYSRSMNPGN